MKIFNNITFKITAGVFFIVTAVTLVLFVVEYRHDKRAIEDRIYAQLNAVADLKKAMVVGYVTERVNDLKILSASVYQQQNLAALLDPRVGSPAKKTARKRLLHRLRSFKNTYLGYMGLEVVDLNGSVLVSTEGGENDGGTSTSSPALRGHAPRQGETSILQEGVGAGRLDFVTGMSYEDEPVGAILVSHISLPDTIFPLFSDYTGLGWSGESLLVRREGGRITDITPARHRLPAPKGLAAPGEEYRTLATRATAGNEGIDQAFDYRGKAVIGAYRYLPAPGWGVVTKIDEDEAFSEIKDLQRKIFMLAFAVLTFMLGMAYLLGRKLTAPIEKLINNTKMITAGHFSALVKSGRTDEIGELEDNFNEMVIALDAARRQAGLKQEDLERKVNERTESLANANAALSRALEDVRRESDEKKLLQAQLLHAQKMEAVGTLAGGVAHDFNNILTAIIGYGSVLRVKLSGDDPNREYIDQILAAAERAAGLTRGLLAFSRRQITTPQPVRLNGVVDRVQGLLARIMGEHIELRVKLDETDPVVLADAGQLEQVVMNLAANARDAMPDGGGFTLATETDEIDGHFIALHGYGQAGRYAVLTASDTGTGMDQKTLTRIFEPFFTTKETGKGTGLGLSIAYGIIKSQHGYINCSSEPGKGTIFTIYLPLTPAETHKPEVSELRQPQGGMETILVAEDSAEVRNLTATILTDSGYQVIEAEDGAEAVRKFAENRDAVDLLLLDIIMPRKNGKDAYDEIRAMRPDVKAIFTSGYTADVIRERSLSDKGLTLLTKPLSPRDLLEKIREVLDGKP